MKKDQLCSAEIRSAFATALSTCQQPYDCILSICFIKEMMMMMMKKMFTLNLSRKVSNRQSFESSSKNRFLVRMRVFLNVVSAPHCVAVLSAL